MLARLSWVPMASLRPSGISKVPSPPRESLTSPGVCAASFVDVECLDMEISIDELHDCIKRLKRGQSPGIEATNHLRSPDVLTLAESLDLQQESMLQK